jgi:hypothetical protein
MRDLLLTDDECKVAWRLRLLLSPVQTLPTHYVCNPHRGAVCRRRRAHPQPDLRQQHLQVSGVARTIHKGNEIIVRTADLRSMDALDPVERLPRQERILRAAAMQEVVEQIHRDQRKQTGAREAAWSKTRQPTSAATGESSQPAQS